MVDEVKGFRSKFCECDQIFGTREDAIKHDIEFMLKRAILDSGKCFCTVNSGNIEGARKRGVSSTIVATCIQSEADAIAYHIVNNLHVIEAAISHFLDETKPIAMPAKEGTGDGS